MEYHQHPPSIVQIARYPQKGNAPKIRPELGWSRVYMRPSVRFKEVDVGGGQRRRRMLLFQRHTSLFDIETPSPGHMESHGEVGFSHFLEPQPRWNGSSCQLNFSRLRFGFLKSSALLFLPWVSGFLIENFQGS